MDSILTTSHYLVHFHLPRYHPQHLHRSYWNSHWADEYAPIYGSDISFRSHLLASLNQYYSFIHCGIVEDLTLS